MDKYIITYKLDGGSETVVDKSTWNDVASFIGSNKANLVEFAIERVGNPTKPTDFTYLFSNAGKLEKCDIGNVDTSEVVSMSGAFSYMDSLTSLDLSNLDTSSVEDMSWVFENGKFSFLNLSGFDTAKVTSMSGMFVGTSQLTSLDLSSFDTSNVKMMNFMFNGCSGLTELDLASFDTSKVENTWTMFRSCSNLKTIYVSDLWDNSSNSNSGFMFDLCTSLVGAVPYDPSKIDISMANYTTGYFTEKLPDYDFITTCNWTQTGTFTLRAFRGFGTNVVTSYTLYYRKKGSPTWNSTTNGEIVIDSTGEWEVANDWNKSGNNVLTHSYYEITAINSCTNVYFNEITLGTTIGDYFLYCWWYDCTNLVSMPVGFNLPQGITSVGNTFLFYCWCGCSNLVSMPVGFNLPSGITSVGNAFLNSCWSGCSKLVNMPIGFNIPSGIVGDVGYNFFGGTWMDCTSLTSIPSGFNFPSGITSVSVSHGLAGACWLNCTNLKQDGNTEDLVFEFDSPNNPFGGTCPIVPDSITEASKANPVRVPVNRPAPPPYRYWVGGSGDWNDTNHWSLSSGGPGGASVPTSDDDVFIDGNSGINGGTIMFDHNGWCKDFICTSGHTYTIKEGDYGGLYISGSLELEPGITWSSRLDLFFDGGGTIKTSGVKLGYVGIGAMLS